jgi:hypothetical protein
VLSVKFHIWWKCWLQMRGSYIHIHVNFNKVNGMLVIMIERSKSKHLLPPFQNIRCFRFVKQMYLDIF